MIDFNKYQRIYKSPTDIIYEKRFENYFIHIIYNRIDKKCIYFIYKNNDELHPIIEKRNLSIDEAKEELKVIEKQIIENKFNV